MKSCNVILDLTEDCMLRCSYCYINGGESRLNMSTQTAINAITKFSKSYADGKIHLLFHGGEPLLMFDRIQDIINFIETNDIRNIELYIQTNGIEADQYISKYLKKKNVRTCVSIDGLILSITLDTFYSKISWATLAYRNKSPWSVAEWGFIPIRAEKITPLFSVFYKIVSA